MATFKNLVGPYWNFTRFSYHILKMTWSPNFKMVWYALLRPLSPELK
jgi:hypothetical protein